MKAYPSRTPTLCCLLLFSANGACNQGFPPPPGPYGLARQATEQPVEAPSHPLEEQTKPVALPRDARVPPADAFRPASDAPADTSPAATAMDKAVKPAGFTSIFADPPANKAHWRTQAESKPAPPENSIDTTPPKTRKPALPSAQFGPVFGTPAIKTPVPVETETHRTTSPTNDGETPFATLPSTTTGTMREKQAPGTADTPKVMPAYPRPGSSESHAESGDATPNPPNWRFAPADTPKTGRPTTRSRTNIPAKKPRPTSPAMWPPVSAHPEAGNIHIPDNANVLHPPNASIQMRWPAPASAPLTPPTPAVAPSEGGKIKSARSLYDALTRPSGNAHQTTTRDALAYPPDQTFRPDASASTRNGYPGHASRGRSGYPTPDTGIPGYYPPPGYPSPNYPTEQYPAPAGNPPSTGYTDPAYPGGHGAPSWGSRYNGPPAPGGDSLQ